MLWVTREKSSGRILLSAHGPLEEGEVNALIQVIALTPEQTPIVIDVDLSRVEISAPDGLRTLAVVLSRRPGLVTFSGSGEGPISAPSAPIVR